MMPGRGGADVDNLVERVWSYRKERLATTTPLSGVGRMYNLNTSVAGEPGPIESENGGQTMHLHSGDQSGIVRRLPDNPMLNDQAFPNRINRRRFGQELKHAF